jgi:hypothetical protein
VIFDYSSASSGLVAFAPGIVVLGPSAVEAGDPPFVATDLRQAIRYYLVNLPAITALVGTRIRFGRFDQADARPGITYSCPGNARGHDLDGSNGSAVARVQFDCWADDPDDALAIKIALEQALDGMQRTDLSGVFVKGCLQQNEVDLTEDRRDASGRYLHHIAVEYRFDYYVSVPAFP